MSLDKNRYEEVKGEAQKEMERVLKLEETRENLKQRLLQKIEDIRLNLKAGKISYDRGDYATSIEHYQLVIELDPENKEALKGFSLSNKKLTKERKKLYKNDIKNLFNEAKILIKNEDYKEAIEAYKNILVMDPENTKALKLLEKAEQNYSFTDDDQHYEELFGRPNLSGAVSVNSQDNINASEDVAASVSDLETETDDYVKELIRESILADKEEVVEEPVKVEEPIKEESKDLSPADIDALINSVKAEEVVEEPAKVEEPIKEESKDLSPADIDALINSVKAEEVVEEPVKVEEPIKKESKDLSPVDIDALINSVKAEEVEEEPVKVEEPIKEESKDLSPADIDALINSVKEEETEELVKSDDSQALSPEDIEALVNSVQAQESIKVEEPVKEESKDLSPADIDALINSVKEEESVEEPEKAVEEVVATEVIEQTPIAESADYKPIRELTDEEIRSIVGDFEISEGSIVVPKNSADADLPIKLGSADDVIRELTAEEIAAIVGDSGFYNPDEEISGSIAVEEKQDVTLDDMDDMLAGVIDEYNSVSGSTEAGEKTADVLAPDEAAVLASLTNKSGEVSGSADVVDMDAMLAGVVEDYNAVAGEAEASLSGVSDSVLSQAGSEEAAMDDMLAGVISDYNNELETSDVTSEKETPSQEEATDAWGPGSDTQEAADAENKAGNKLEEQLDSDNAGEAAIVKEDKELPDEILKSEEPTEPKKFYQVVFDKIKSFLCLTLNFKIGTILVVGIMLALSIGGWVLFQKQTDTSAKFFMKYIEKIEKQIDKADVLLKEGETEKAFQELSMVSGILPGETHGIDMHYAIIDLFRKRGGTEHNVLRAAIELYEDLTRKYANNTKVSKAYMEIGNCYMALKLYDDAIDRYKVLLQKFPTSEHVAETLLNIGKCYLKMGEYSKAKRGLFSLYSNYPDTEFAQEALYELGNCFDAEAKKLAED